MTPAVTAIPETTEGNPRPSCYRCLGELSDAALRCSNCQSHVHFQCSGLPDYQIIRLTLTQSSFNCSKCVLAKDAKGDKEKYDEELNKIKEIVTKEVSIIAKINADIEQSENNTDQSKPDQTDEVANTTTNYTGQKSNTPLCKYYLRRECQFGRVGKDCKFHHPKICQLFSKNGDRRGGCKRGRDCKDYHPKVCHESMERKECTRGKCRFYHLNGTKSTFDGGHMEIRDVRNHIRPNDRSAERQETGALYSQKVKYGRGTIDYTQRGGTRAPQFQNSVSPQAQESGNSQDFFLIEQRMQRLETMISSILQSVRPPGLPSRLPEQH